MRNLTVERLRRFSEDEIIKDKDKVKWKVWKIWCKLESEDFDNDSQRNNWLRIRGFKIK